MKTTESTWYRIALFCGILPAVLGIAVSIAWWWTRSDRAIWLGAWTFSLGVLLVCSGIVALAMAHCREPRPTVLATTLALALLALNFPVAYAATALPALARTTYALDVTNATGAIIENVTFAGAGLHFGLANLSPGETRRCVFRPSVEGLLRYEAGSDTSAAEGEAGGKLLLRESRRIQLQLLPAGGGETSVAPHSWSFLDTLRIARTVGLSRGAAAFW